MVERDADAFILAYQITQDYTSFATCIGDKNLALERVAGMYIYEYS